MRVSLFRLLTLLLSFAFLSNVSFAQLNLSTVTTDVTCNGTCDGTVDLTVGAGTTPYTFMWSNAAASEDLTNLCAGIYGVTVTDNLGMMDSTNVTILEPAALLVTTNGFNQSCTGICDGSASASVMGGVPPYTYLWDDPGATTTANAIWFCAGTYTVWVVDINGCTVVTPVTITDPGPMTVTITTTNATQGNCDGTASVATTSGGNAPYTYMWDDPGTQFGGVAVGLCAGSICLNVTGSSGCVANSCDTVDTDPCVPLGLTFSFSNTSCDGFADGSATANPSLGTPPYTYAWNDMLLQTTATATGLLAGSYMITVTDSLGCDTIATVTISQPPPMATSSSVTDAACGVCDGDATVTATGLAIPYTYIWTNGDSAPMADSLCAGIHAIQITDSSGCTFDSLITINNSSGPVATLIDSTQTLCNGDSTGHLGVSVTGGNVPYTYQWDDYLAQTTDTAYNLPGGTYSVQVTDSLGCQFILGATVTEPPPLTMSLNTTNETCTGWADGSVVVTAGGGSGMLICQGPFGWGLLFNFDSLMADSLPIDVMDTNGCIVSDIAIIQGGSTVSSIPIINTSTICGWLTTVYINPSGGQSPYSSTWTPSPEYSYFNGSNVAVAAGLYAVTITDANGCSTTLNVNVTDACPPNRITGQVFNDNDANCSFDGSDYPLSGWIIEATPGPHYASTDDSGYYQMYLDSGTYWFQLLDNDDLRQGVCPSGNLLYQLFLDTITNTTANVDFSLQPIITCPRMAVDVFTSNLRPCMSSTVTVQYCNTGTDSAYGSTVDITLDNGITYNSGGPFLGSNGATLTFDIGNVGPLECGIFYFSINVDCSTALGSTKCLEARIFPDSICEPIDSVWDRSSVSVSGACVGDSACFTITNTGDPGIGDMLGTSEYRIYENNILVYTGSFQLAGGTTISICWFANNNTIRLEADQRPGHPGNSNPQDNVEMCGVPTFTINQINQTSQDDLDPFLDVYCRLVTGSYDPNDKQVQPTGLIDAFHFIDSTQVLEYQIRFQNTGTDTAFMVAVRDTLDVALDISTLDAGVSSHPYSIQFFDNNVVQFTFDNILLPDSNINEAESHGFVKFKINQVVGNVDGTRIENRVGIIFDFNSPVITNTVFNTVGDIDSIVISQPKVYTSSIDIKVYPNPFSEETTFEFSGDLGGKNIEIQIFNSVGQKVKSISGSSHDTFILNRKGMADGLYYYQIHSGVDLVGAGKLIVQ